MIELIFLLMTLRLRHTQNLLKWPIYNLRVVVVLNKWRSVIRPNLSKSSDLCYRAKLKFQLRRTSLSWKRRGVVNLYETDVLLRSADVRGRRNPIGEWGNIGGRGVMRGDGSPSRALISPRGPVWDSLHAWKRTRHEAEQARIVSLNLYLIPNK